MPTDANKINMTPILIYNSATGVTIYRSEYNDMRILSLFFYTFYGTKRRCRSCLRRFLRDTHYKYAFHFTEGKHWLLTMYDNE